MIVECNTCKKVKAIPVTSLQYMRWKRGELIQNVMPNIPEDDRELLISGICGKCFDKPFQGRKLK